MQSWVPLAGAGAVVLGCAGWAVWHGFLGRRAAARLLRGAVDWLYRLDVVEATLASVVLVSLLGLLLLFHYSPGGVPLFTVGPVQLRRELLVYRD